MYRSFLTYPCLCPQEVQPPLPAGAEGPGHRAGGYVAFWVDVPADTLKSGGANELFVLADNRFNHTTAPMHTGGDFWHYGGLTRSVELHTMAEKEAVLWRAYVLPTGADPVAGTTSAPDSIDMTLVLSSPEDGPVDVTVAFDGGKATAMKAVAAKGEATLKKIPVPSPKLWSPDEPNLHTVTVTYKGGSVTERFGLRSFGVEKESARITVNGKVVKLVGWNHHTQWPVTAASPTDDQMDADIALLKKGNANYVRGAHYPHDPRMIDRFDEAGILFWSETLGPSVSSENMNDWDFFMKYQLQQLEQMLDNAMNHASILTWGWFNEGPSNQAKNCPAYAANGDYARKRDPSRFTTWADDNDNRGQCYAHATLIAFNDYPGWYNHQGDPEAPKQWSDLAAAVRGGTTASGAATLGKQMVISETGAAGIYEWSANKTDAKWTLKYQSEVISTCVETAIACPNISGITLWHFYDFKVDNCGAQWPCKKAPAQPNAGAGQENNTHCIYDHDPPTTFAALKSEGPPNCTSIVVNGRPGGENHKGSLDFWRREKPAFGETAAKYKDAQLNDGYHVQQRQQ
jgi:beta-glucuronidase